MKKFLSMIITAAMLICMQSASFAAARIPVYRANGAIFFFDKASGRISGFAGEPKDLIMHSADVKRCKHFQFPRELQQLKQMRL